MFALGHSRRTTFVRFQSEAVIAAREGDALCQNLALRGVDPARLYLKRKRTWLAAATVLADTAAFA
jgi:hypothetical protein